VVVQETPLPQWLTMDEAVVHCTEGMVSGNGQATIRMPSGRDNGLLRDTPTLEILAAVTILHKNLPDLKIR